MSARSLRDYGERERYESVLSGWNSRLDELQAAILLAKLPRLEEWTTRRRAIAERTARRSLQPAATQLEPAGFRHAYHLYVVRRRTAMACGGDSGSGASRRPCTTRGRFTPHPAYLDLGTRAWRRASGWRARW